MQKTTQKRKFYADFEFWLLVLGSVAIFVVGIIFKSWWLTIASSLLSFACCVFCAMGKVYEPIFGFIALILYSFLSFYNKFYGEIIINIFIMMPLYIWQIVEWIKHQDKETRTVLVSEIKLKEWLSISVISIAVFVGFYFLLRALNTSELIISTLSILGNLIGMYLLVRRSKYGFVSYIVDDIIFLLLWSIPLFKGDLSLLPIVITPILNLMSDIYGVANWNRLQKLQKIKNKGENYGK